MKESPHRDRGLIYSFHPDLHLRHRIKDSVLHSLRRRRAIYLPGTIGKINAEGRLWSWKITFVAEINCCPDSGCSAVFRLRSNRGKLLLEISRRRAWPLRKTLLVDHRSMVSLYT